MAIPILNNRYPITSSWPDAIPGVDFSWYQRNVDQSVRIPWAKFLIMKVSEGLSQDYGQDLIYPKTIAPYRGAYHFARPRSNSARSEANAFLAQYNKFTWELPPSLDIEANESSLGRGDIEWCLTWGDIVRNATQKRPLLYSSYKYIQNNLLDPRIAEMYDLWIGAPDYVPFDRPSNNIPPWNDWIIWQHTVDDIDNNVTTQARLDLLLGMRSKEKDKDMPYAVRQLDGLGAGTIWVIGNTRLPLVSAEDWPKTKQGIDELVSLGILQGYIDATEAAINVIPIMVTRDDVQNLISKIEKVPAGTINQEALTNVKSFLDSIVTSANNASTWLGHI